MLSTPFFFRRPRALRIIYKSPKTSAVGKGRKGLYRGGGGGGGDSGIEPPPDRLPVVTSRYNNCVLDGSAAARPRNFKTIRRRRTRPEAHAQIPTTPPTLPPQNPPSSQSRVFIRTVDFPIRATAPVLSPNNVFFFSSLFLYYYYFLLAVSLCSLSIYFFCSANPAAATTQNCFLDFGNIT